MSVTNDMMAAYRRPGQVMQRHVQAQAGEDRALIFVMAACLIFFVSRLPVISRNAFLNQTDMQPEVGGAALAWLFIAPLGLYIIAALLRMILRLVGCRASWFHTRLALFWALLAGTPLILLNGLVGGFIGPGLEQTIVGGLWFASFLWILGGSLQAVCKAS